MSQTNAFSSDYLSISDLLATQERISCKFQMKVHRLGFLDPSCDGEHIEPNTKLELPFWLAQALCSRRRHVVDVAIPRTYKEAYREILLADANVVDLHKLSPAFYRFGSYLLSFDHAESADIAKCLIQTFKARFRRIMESSLNSVQGESSFHLINKLDESERELFSAGQLCLKEHETWQNREINRITTSTLVANHKKRKRLENE